MQGITNNFNAVEMFIHDENIHILCASEHWITNNELLQKTIFNNYKIASIFMRNEHIHGGVLILVRKELHVTEIKSIKQWSVECHIEITSILLKVDTKKIAVIAVYRPPSGDFDVFHTVFNEALKVAFSRSDNVVLAGDLNIDWEKSTGYRNLLEDIFDSFHLHVNNLGATRIFTNAINQKSSSTIDYMATSLPSCITTCELVQPNIADHLAHILKINWKNCEISENQSSKITKRDLRLENVKEFQERLKNTDWSCVYRMSVERGFEYLLNSIYWCYEVSCPKRTFTQKKKTHNWFTEDLKNESDNLKNLFWLSQQTTDNSLLKHYKNKQKEYKANLRKAKMSHNVKKINESNNKIKTTWNIINEELGKEKKQSNDIALRNQANLIEIPNEVANTFAKHFSTVAAEEIRNHFPPNLSLPCTTLEAAILTPFRDEWINEEEVIENLQGMKNKTSSGIDELSVITLKQIMPFILKPFTFLINQSLIQGTFPSMLKKSLIIPIHKKGDKLEIDNYRQITLVSSISKLFEKIIASRITSYLVANSVLSEHQHGFRRGRSTESAIYEMLNFTHTKLDQGKFVVSVYFDLSKAFDTISPYFLLQKMQTLKFPRNVLTWIQSYIEERTMVVKYKGAVSEEQNINIGVPQGSVLGPLLFLIFINDLPVHTTSDNIIMFADDTTMTIVGNSHEELSQKLEKVIEEFKMWCERNRLILNMSKSLYVESFGGRNNQATISINDIRHAEETTFLGVLIDQHLSWNTQVNSICSKLNSAYYAIRILKNSLNREGLMKVYYAMVYSPISYSIMAWGRSKDMNRVFVNQKRIVRLIFNLDFQESCKPTFIKYKILTIPSIYILKCVLFVRRNLQKYNMNGHCHEYNTRHNEQLRIPLHHTTKFKKSPIYNTTVLYNKLPAYLKSSGTAKKFHSGVKIFLQEGAFYSVQEFLDRDL